MSRNAVPRMSNRCTDHNVDSMLKYKELHCQNMDGALCEYSYARCHKCRQDAVLRYKELHCQNIDDALCEYSYARCHKADKTHY